MRDPAADLLDRGASTHEIDDARRDGTLHLLALDYTLFPGAHYLTLPEAAERAGLGRDVAVRIARALGLVESLDEHVYGDDDVDALVRMADWLGSGVDLDVALALYRVMGSAMARIAESEVGFVASTLTEAFARGTPDIAALLAHIRAMKK